MFEDTFAKSSIIATLKTLIAILKVVTSLRMIEKQNAESIPHMYSKY
jgi:hypothetical protein